MLVGITTAQSDGEIISFKQNKAYADYVLNAGFTPVLIPIGANPDELARSLDVLLISGGIDLNPTYYGYENFNSYGVDPIRDDYERSLITAFIRTKKPIFGICRGMQLLCREFILTEARKQGISHMLGYLEHVTGHQQGDLNLSRSTCCHYVKAKVNSLYHIEEAADPIKTLWVNSLHHQAVYAKFIEDHRKATVASMLNNVKALTAPTTLNLGSFEILAWSSKGIKQSKILTEYNCIVEAMKINGLGSPIMGVQWHPEELKDYALFANFVNSNAVQIKTTN